MAYDYSKLSGKIKEVFGTNAAFAKAMGLSERSVSAKLTGKVGWKQVEMFLEFLKALRDAILFSAFFAEAVLAYIGLRVLLDIRADARKGRRRKAAARHGQ